MSEQKIHEVIASSFADPADVRRFLACKRQGKSDMECFKVGDNGLGMWGDLTAQEVIPMCALPPEDIVERWGSLKAKAARGRKVLVRANGTEVLCLLSDRMPYRSNIKNGAGIDVNPAASKALGLEPPHLVPATWQWGE